MHFKNISSDPPLKKLNDGHTILKTTNKDGSIIYVEKNAKVTECCVDQSLDSSLFTLQCLIDNHFPIGDVVSGSYIEASPETVINAVQNATNILNSIPNEEGTNS